MVMPAQKEHKIPINKGTRGGLQIVAWDAVGNCEKDLCKIYLMCPYRQRIKCKVQIQYLKALNRMILTNYDKVLTEPMIYQIGMLLVPLYKHLCRMKIEELGTRRTTYVTDQGSVRVQPIYSEIRKTIRLILQCWKELGLDGHIVGGGPELKRIKGVSPGYEDELFEEDPDDEV